MNNIELTLAPAASNEAMVERTWEKIPVRDCFSDKRHHAIPVSNDEEFRKNSFRTELKEKLDKEIGASDKKVEHKAAHTERNETVAVNKKSANKNTETENVGTKDTAETATDIDKNNSTDNIENTTPVAVTETAVVEKEPVDPVDQLIGEKIDKIVSLMEKLGIEVDAETISSKDFIEKAIKVLEHLLNPVREESVIAVRISVDEAVADILTRGSMISEETLGEEISPDELIPVMEALLAELTALQMLMTNVAKSEKNGSDTAVMIEAKIVDTKLPAMAEAGNNKIEEKATELATKAETVVVFETENKIEGAGKMDVPLMVAAQKEAVAENKETQKPLPDNKTAETAEKQAVHADKIIAKSENEDSLMSNDEKNNRNYEEAPESGKEPVEIASLSENIEIETSENFATVKTNPVIKAIGELKEIVANMGSETSNHVKAVRAESVEAQRAESTQGFARPNSDKAVMQQITTRFQLITAQHGSEMRIQLKPEHLGTVKISLEIHQETVIAKLQVDSDRVKHIVESNMQQLKETLEEQGLKMEKFDVSVNDGRDEFFKRELSENGRRIRGKIRQEIGFEGESDELTTAAPDTGRQLGYSTVAFVG